MTYSEFWKTYLLAHQRPGNRALHYAGSVAAIALLLSAAVAADWRFLAASIVVGYGFAWIGHVAIERNRPGTFGHPIWSLISDFRMLGLWSAGRLRPHLLDAGPRHRN